MFACHTMADPILTPPSYSKVVIRYLEGEIVFLLTVLRINKLSQDLFHVIKKNLWLTNPNIYIAVELWQTELFSSPAWHILDLQFMLEWLWLGFRVRYISMILYMDIIYQCLWMTLVANNPWYYNVLCHKPMSAAISWRFIWLFCFFISIYVGRIPFDCDCFIVCLCVYEGCFMHILSHILFFIHCISWSLRDEPFNFKWEGYICYLVFWAKIIVDTMMLKKLMIPPSNSPGIKL